MHLSKVDLPEPFRPRIPTVSPSRTCNETSLSAQKSSVGVPPAVDDALLEGVVAPMGQPESLGDALDVDRDVAHRLELLGKVALEPPEDDSATRKRRGEGEDPHVEGEIPEKPVERQDVEYAAARPCRSAA